MRSLNAASKRPSTVSTAGLLKLESTKVTRTAYILEIIVNDCPKKPHSQPYDTHTLFNNYETLVK